MFSNDGKTIKMLDLSKDYGNSEDSPTIIEPLRIHKPKNSNSPKSNMKSEAYHSQVRPPYPFEKYQSETDMPYAFQSYYDPVRLTDTQSNSEKSNMAKENSNESSNRSDDQYKENKNYPKLGWDREVAEQFVTRTGPSPDSISELQDSKHSNQFTSSSKLENGNLESTSQFPTYLLPNRFQGQQQSSLQELDASPVVKHNSFSSNINGMNRFTSSVSFSTTRASRGSPPPESPPLESPPINSEIGHQIVNIPTVVASLGKSGETEAISKEFQQLYLPQSPPPAYSSASLSSLGDIQTDSNERQAKMAIMTNSALQKAITNPTNSTAPAATTPPSEPCHPEHPAFAKESRIDQASTRPISQVTPAQQYINPYHSQEIGPKPTPLLPEGWVTRLDQNSGQYYFIHTQTQATQWEFPISPTPLNYNGAPLSLGLSTYGNSLVSPGTSTFGTIPVSSPGSSPFGFGHNESIMSIASQTPTLAEFSGPPPSAGVDMYKIVPKNGVYFGPYLRYINMDIQRGIWLGSIMLLTDNPQPPTIHIHRTVDLSPDPRQLEAHLIFTHQRWKFYRYNLDLNMNEELSERWTYAITSHLGCTRYDFLVAGRSETQWRFIAHSGNDFAVNTSINDRSKLGGIGLMWKDILQKHTDCGGFHAQLGLGDQIYGDRIWKEIPFLKQWIEISGKENRKNASWTARYEEDVSHAYFHYYTSHFDQNFLREAFAQIPHILQINHHDIFDGFGSYPDYLQSSDIFKNIGRIGTEMYLLFQHHTTPDMIQKDKYGNDLFTVTGTGWHFVKHLGPALVVAGPDCRSERNQRQVLSTRTYQGLFPKVAALPSCVQHCIWMISVPLIYPRFDTVESIAHTLSTAKRGVTGTFNLLGRMTSSVAGVVGGKQAVASGFSQVKKVVGKSGLMGGILNTFGEIDIADELRDMWSHESKDLERTYFIRTLQTISYQRGIRMTFLSGDVNCGGAGLVHDPSHPSSHKTMYQIISSAVVAAPAPSYLLRMLHNNKVLYVPASGHKTTNAVSDTKEDMMELFQSETNGAPRELKKLMGRRNYVVIRAYTPETIIAINHGADTAVWAQQQQQQQHESRKVSLAVDFIVQGEGSLTGPSKYGPVIIPCVERGWR